MQYLGRSDFQVKIRGLRIELGEIESALTALPAISQAAVVVREDHATAPHLVAYLVTTPTTTTTGTDSDADVDIDSDAGVDIDRVRGSLARTLPAYMLPTTFVVLDRLPLNASGKLDRTALPAPAPRATVLRAPTTPVEEIVAATFAEVLGLPRVGLDDDFFALGGNSLTATQVTARLSTTLDTDLGVRELFDAPTVAALADRAEASRGAGARAPLRPLPRPERIPLSPAQQRIWFLNRFHADDRSTAADAIDNIPIVLHMSGDLDVAALTTAVADLVARHETLRTVYPDGPDGPEQVIMTAVDPDVSVVRVSESALAGQLHALAGSGFDLTAEIPLRAALFDVSDAQDPYHVLAIVLHHICADGFSLGPLAEDLMTAYTSRRSGVAPGWAPLPVQYVDYTLWQAEVTDSETQLDYWRGVLDRLPEHLELPTDRPRPSVSSYQGATHRLRIDSDLHSELRELARKRETTLFSTVHAALAVLLARVSGGSDIAIGTPVAGRGAAALDRLIGMFVNTVVLRTAVDSRARFETVLDAVRDQDIDALSHAEAPFERLVEALAPTRARNRHPLFQVALTFQNFALPDVRLPGLQVRMHEFDSPVAEFDLQFTVLESNDKDGRADGLGIEIRYATELFDASTIAVLGRRFTQVLAAIAADPTVVVGDIQLLSAEEQRRALYEWAVGEADTADVTGTMAARFARAAARQPAVVAVRDGARSLSYAELDSWSNRLARRLIAVGVGPEALVAVALPRSLELTVALLAVLKAGGGYLPIDPAYPRDRIEYVLNDAHPICAITGTTTELPPEWFDGPVLDVAAPELDALSGESITDTDRRGTVRADHAAYVIYTSGSTGHPKGVVVPHGNVLRLLDNTHRHFGFGPADVWTLFHSYAFDFSVWELWGALLSGGTLVVVDYYTARSPQQFRALLVAEKVTVLNQTPSAFYQLVAADLTEPEPADFALRTVIFGGEALEPQRLTGWLTRYRHTPGLVNMYGITETTVHVSYRELGSRTDSASVIGAALPGLTVRLLDDRLRPVPVGVPGEIYVSGGQLARGYLHRRALTAGRFVADPYASDGSRAYRSGDVARWTADGDIEYLGRADQQVNLRGFRIELGEIEAALLDSAATVHEVAVVVRTDLVDEPRLVAYVVTGDDAVDTVALRHEVGARVPEHMVPSAIVAVDRIPLTVNGKLDRAALPAPQFESTVYRAPTTASERVVSEVFAQVLGLEREVGADDDFFALGGSSLLAAKATARIGAALGRTVGVRALFDAPRVTDLAAVVSAVAMGDARPVLMAGPRPERIPLSPAQQRMWFLNRYDQSSTAYNIPVALRLSGVLDVPALQSALGDVVARHEALRTRYPQVDGVPMQVIESAARATPELELGEVSEQQVPTGIRELAETTFDVTTEVPVRMRLLRVDRTAARHERDQAEFVLAAVLHHIAADGSSIAPFVRDLMIAYSARRDGMAPAWSAPVLQYADYALWQRDLLGVEDDHESVAAREIAFWTKTLAGLPDQLALPTDHPRPVTQSLRGAKEHLSIDQQLHADLVALGRRHAATLFMVVHTAFAALLARWSGSADIAVGTPVAGRGAAELDDVIGMFVNTVVLRVGVEAGASFDSLLARARDVDLAALDHTAVPFERLVEVLNPVRSTARHPLFQVGYSFQNHDRGQVQLPDLDVHELDFDSGVAQFDLHLFVVDHYHGDGRPAGLELTLGYATDLFEPVTAQRFIAQLGRVLQAAVAQPDLPVGDIDVLGSDRALVLTEWNRTRHPIPDVTLSDLFDAQAARSPGAVALIDAHTGAELSYAELDARVNRVARRLIEAGIGPESTVVLAMRRSLELVVAMYAVVRAGGAYVPIDPDHPAERIAHIMATAAPAAVLTTSRDTTPLETSCTTMDIDRLDLARFDSSPIVDSQRIRPLRPDHPAYVVFTSGSTGLPKGVAVTHAAVVNQLSWLAREFTLGGHDRVLLKTPATFDLSVWEFWSALLTGGRLIVTPPGAERDPDQLRALLHEHEVTMLHAVPSLIGMLLAVEPDLPLPPSVRHVLAIGEALPPATAADFLRRHHGATVLHNLYGPTEAAVSITSFTVRAEQPHAVPIGAPVWNSRAYVLDARLRPAPIGVPGELYLAGAQLARGYQHRPGLTADRFVADPYAAEGQRMYRTGDVVRWRPDGTMEYLQRADFQVQIGGFRIELGELETVLRQQPGVAAAVAVSRTDGGAGTRIIAYAAVPEAAADTHAELAMSLRAALATRLPAYMTPAAVIVLEALPLTANGKIDRTALPTPVFAEAAFRTPSSELERLVADTFAEVIGLEATVDTLSVDDDFFARGGNSLMATRLAARLGAAVGGRVPVATVFEAPTVGALALRLADIDRDGARPALVRRADAGPTPLAPAQQRIWVLTRLAPDSSAYHVPMALRLRGAVDAAVLTAAVADVLDRHEPLRTRYPDTAEGPIQEVVSAPVVDLTPTSVSDADLDARIATVVSAGFDITAAPPVRAELFATAPDDYVLVVVLHHIGADGYSVAPLTSDLVRAYVARSAGRAPEWSPLPIQYRDFGAWHWQVLGDEADPDSLLARQLAFWKQELAGAPALLALPTDRARPARRDGHGAVVIENLDRERAEALERLARAHNGTLFTLVHSALAVLLAKLSGTTDIVVGAPVAGRGVRELDELVGMFVNTVALRTDVDPRVSFGDLLRQATRRDLVALSHADVPFEQVVEALGVTRSGSYPPLFQVLLTFQNMPRGSVELPGLQVEPIDLTLGEAKFDIQLTVVPRSDDPRAGLELHFGYATDIFDASTVQEFGVRLLRVLDAVVEDPRMTIRAIDIRTDDERRPRPAATMADLPELVARAAGVAPTAPAFEHDGRTIGFAELDAKFTAVAKALGTAAKPESLIHVSLAGLVPGILAAVGGNGLAALLQTLLATAETVLADPQSAVDSEGNR
ncbi:non-ribosomal peptide synthetase [Nocardia sp. CNY236]|uniref:non-ribosomal peptide synthetase n=1 Tax=Nocardia sp. CNY236 TaxID=1169152 RepID=UPI0003FC1004|nr:non-ribosomal peptide synthetase [Nocardia sp. CNY236]